MGLTNHGILDIVNLAYYVPVLPLTVYIVVKQGFRRQQGWVYLAFLALLRIVGAVTGLLAQNNPTQSLIECSAITYGIGVTPLLLALLGIIGRVNQSMSVPRLSARLLHLAHLPVLVGLIFAVLGGLDEFNTNPDTQNSGYHNLKISTGLYLIMLIVFTLMAVFLLTCVAAVAPPERKLLYLALFSLPFFAVRVAYSVLTAYDHTSPYFSTTSNATDAVAVEGGMSVAMEFIIVAVYLVGGFGLMKQSTQPHLQKTMSPPLPVQYAPDPRFTPPGPAANVRYMGQGQGPNGYNGGYSGVRY